MSFMTPILIVPSLYCACAEPHPNATAIAVRPISPFMAFSPVDRFFVVCTPASQVTSVKSYPEVIVKLVEVGLELGIGEPIDDATVLYVVIAVGDRRSEAKILLDQEYGEALLLEQANGLADLLNDDRRQTLGRLVEEQEPGPRAQDPADRQHLLFAPRKLRSLTGQAFFEVGKELEDARKVETAGADPGGQQEVFLDAEACENAALLGTERNAQPRNPIAGQADELLALVAHRSGALGDNAHDRFQRRRLSGAIATEQRHHLARKNLERGAVQDMGLAVPGLQPFDREQGCNARARHGQPRDRPRARADRRRPGRSCPRRAPGRG